MLNYSIDLKNDGENSLGQYLEIPESVSMPSENILVSFTQQSTQRQVLMELNAKDYYSQYSETVVILYNYARIKTIIERYQGLNDYPPLPCLENVDFNLIGESKVRYSIDF
jgi:hypothetical protein